MENNLLDFVKDNMEVIRTLKDDYLKQCGYGKYSLSVYDMINQIDVMDISNFEQFGFDEVDFGPTAYEHYTHELFVNDWNKFKPTFVMVGDELDTMFITDQDLPREFGNVIVGADYVFFGSIVNMSKQLEPFEVNGKTLYISFTIPDPGSN